MPNEEKTLSLTELAAAARGTPQEQEYERRKIILIRRQTIALEEIKVLQTGLVPFLWILMILLAMLVLLVAFR